ncbi:MAG TPA: type II secretion system protein [Accumulibacter sp.]|nr:type II secretion system protein [Accumulibacter sp.]HMW18831.1 type II secretion system protein [Accumulibacter sp.]HMX23225.1 type II secretion system protein [Accumulibacter sp.]HMY06484.1 type II secretion system protein [Accumulibacter sp.]HNC16985.1 type II secretion system protein [Accumulibacter sp.]
MSILSKPSSGFTLTEVAVVLIIVGLLLGGMLGPLSAQNDLRATNETRAAMAEIREALIGYAVANGRLPCPADPALANTDPSAGIGEDPASGMSCASVAGVLPWVTLGVGETDAWGNRFSYVVSAKFTRKPPLTAFVSGECTGTPTPALPTSAGFALCTTGDIRVDSTVGGSKVAVDLPVVIVSHGKNGRGAFLTSGKQIPISSDNDEFENLLVKDNSTGKWKNAGTNTPTVLIKKAPTVGFDDELTWISTPLLLSRMMSAGKLP